MDDRNKKKIIERYNRRFEEFGVSIQTLASGTEERRRLRFDILRQIGIENNDSVLDLGCGFGDFWKYCKEAGLNVRYLGVDINPLLIDEARKRFPDARFEVMDIQKDDIPPVDYVVSTTSFNLALENEDNYKFAADILRLCYHKAGKGVAIDFLSDYVDFRGIPEAFHYNPERIFSIAKKITKRVCLRHDYPVFEFCVYLYPDFTGWKSP